MIWAAISRTFLSSSSRHSAVRCSALGQCLRAAILRSQITTVLGFCPGGRPRRPFEEPSGLPDWPFGNRLMLGSLSCPRSDSILVYKATNNAALADVGGVGDRWLPATLLPAAMASPDSLKIGRASCRER